MKLSELVNSREALGELGTLTFKAAKAFEFKVFLKAASEEIQTFNDVRNAKLKELGTPDEKGERYTFTEENSAKFTEELNQLLDKDIAIDVPTLTIADLGEQSISIASATQLDWLIK